MATLKFLTGKRRGEQLSLAEGKIFTIGRSSTNDLYLKDHKVSRIHCQLELADGILTITDMNSTNGTYVNGEKVTEKILQPGDHLCIGLTAFLCEGEKGKAPARPKPAGAVRFCSHCGGSIPAKHLETGEATWVGDKLVCPECLPGFLAKQAKRVKPKGSARGLTPESFIGKTIAGNRILEKIADGNLGTVFRGEHVTLHRPVAVKILLPEVAAEKAWVKTYLRRAHEGGRLVHPNIVLIYDIGAVEDIYYIAMEYVPGETVRAMVKRLKRIPPDKAVNIAIQLTEAIDHAREHGVLHKDIKPKNILVDKQGVPKLFGFGSSAYVLRAPSKVLAKAHPNVRDFRFCSPEFFNPKEPLDFRSDIYSLGATLYYMLTGNAPFHAETNRDLVKKIQEDTPRPVRAVAEDVSEHLARIVEKMMAKSPDLRYQSPQDLLLDLQQAAKEMAK